MSVQRRRVIPQGGLRLRSSPRDGRVLEVLRQGDEVEILGQETWYHVKAGPLEGYVLSDHTEQVEPGDSRPELVTIEDPNFFGAGPIIVHRDFEPRLLELGARAAQLEIRIYVVSSLREPNVPVSGAIASPVRYSNHLIGHAIDFNLATPNGWYNSTRLMEEHAPGSPVEAFLQQIEALDLRWGGKFASPDPVHIDDAVNVTRPAEYRETLWSLWGRGPQSVRT